MVQAKIGLLLVAFALVSAKTADYDYDNTARQSHENTGYHPYTTYKSVPSTRTVTKPYTVYKRVPQHKTIYSHHTTMKKVPYLKTEYNTIKTMRKVPDHHTQTSHYTTYRKITKLRYDQVPYTAYCHKLLHHKVAHTEQVAHTQTFPQPTIRTV